MYHELPARLVNEVQKDHRAISELERTKTDPQRKIEQDEAMMAEQQRDLSALTARLTRLESATRLTATR